MAAIFANMGSAIPSRSSSPLPEIQDVAEMYITCVVTGGAKPVDLQERLCSDVEAELGARGHSHVSVVKMGDLRTQQPKALLIALRGAVQTDSGGLEALAIAVQTSRADMAQSRLMPAKPVIAPLDHRGELVDGVAPKILADVLDELGL